MEITPFTKIVFKVGQSHWSEKINKCHSMFLNVEYLSVCKDLRKATIGHIDSAHIEVTLEKYYKDNLIFTPLHVSSYYQGFSHKHRPPEPGKPFFIYGALTKSYKDAEIFKNADKVGDHKAIGELLGYPDCCTSYFSEIFSKNYDPMWVEINGTTKGYVECNQLLRYFGIRITSHMSCSPYCEKTRSVGAERLKLMREIDETSTDNMITLLKTTNWNSYHGIVEADTPYFLGLTHSFPLDKKRVLNFKATEE
jgi:hypothetical protein